MSARAMSRHINFKDDSIDVLVFLAFHEGKFDKFEQKLPELFTKCKGEDIPLIVHTEATYKQLPHDILDSIRWRRGDTTVP